MIDFDAKLAWFRDDEQRERVRRIVQERIADDRRPEEARYLMRFHWHLIMSYREVSYAELVEHLEPDALAAIDALLVAVSAGPVRTEAVDAWCDRMERERAIVEDRGWHGSQGLAYVTNPEPGGVTKPDD